MKPWVWVRVIVDCAEKSKKSKNGSFSTALTWVWKEIMEPRLQEDGGVTHRGAGQDTAGLRCGIRAVRSTKCMAQANVAPALRLFCKLQ